MITAHCECGAGPFTQDEFITHECGVAPPEPDMGPPPASTRDVVEALQALALQIALVNETCQQAVYAYNESIVHQRDFHRQMVEMVGYYVGRVQVQE